MSDNSDDSESGHRRQRAWEHTLRRDAMAEQGLKSLLLLNGGASVALLAFLQAIWTKSEARFLVPWVVAGMVPLILGAASSGWAHFLRYETSETYQSEGREAGRRMTKRHKIATSMSLIMFLVGMSIVIIGALMNLPR